MIGSESAHAHACLQRMCPEVLPRSIECGESQGELRGAARQWMDCCDGHRRTGNTYKNNRRTTALQLNQIGSGGDEQEGVLSQVKVQ